MWTTSVRYHDNKVVQCIFGCRGAPDGLKHYVMCPRLWDEVDEACDQPEDQVDSPLQRMLLDCPSNERIGALTVAFSVCYSVKNGSLDAITQAETSHDFTCVLSLAREAATAYVRTFAR